MCFLPELLAVARWIVNQPMKLSAMVFSLLSLSTMAALGAERPDLTGTVLTDAGKPLANATVFIYTAGPKVGVGTL